MDLPIYHCLEDIKASLRRTPTLVVQAPPGAGKTTVVPLALLDEPWAKGLKLLVLEPRRLAARAAAHRLAANLGESVGRTVGFRTRLESVPGSRIEVLTEGILTRIVQENPELPGVAAVIFDEFHERSLNADLGLALCLEAREAFRPDLRLLVMSATLDGAKVAAFLDAPQVVSEGKVHPVELRYAPRRPERLEQAVVDTVHAAIRERPGGILVFLPGEREIHRTAELLRSSKFTESVLVAPLYGNLPFEQQELALNPAPAGTRKIALASSIAETSLTIEDVRMVIDSGLARAPRFDPGSGLSRLETRRVSKAAADQRAGRAGRLAPGVCHRLWPEASHRELLDHDPPEILEADLSSLALELANWGTCDARALRWLDPPPAAAFAHARELLTALGLLEPDGRVSADGRRALAFGASPRLAKMMARSADLKLGALAADLAAILSERDFLRAPFENPDCDLRSRLDALRNGSCPSNATLDRGALQRVKLAADRWKRQLRAPRSHTAEESAHAGRLLALAYPDRVAAKRPDVPKAFLMANGRGACFAHDGPLSRDDYLVVADLDARDANARIYLAAPIAKEEIYELFETTLRREKQLGWDAARQAVTAFTLTKLGELVLKRENLTKLSPEDLAMAMADGVRKMGLETLPWTKDVEQWRRRALFCRKHLGDAWPDLSDAALLTNLDQWLAPFLGGVRKKDELRHVDLRSALASLVPNHLLRQLDELAPKTFQAPSGSRLAIDYSIPEAPAAEVKVQEVFGLKRTPLLAGGKVPLALRLLSPARRPVQTTADIAGFWTGSYQYVKKDLKGRYPKHSWPDNPAEASPTSGLKPRAEKL